VRKVSKKAWMVVGILAVEGLVEKRGNESGKAQYS
jgi:hypothetical protein